MTEHNLHQTKLTVGQLTVTHKKNVMISGVSGFVGRAVFKHLLRFEDDFEVIGTSRSPLSLHKHRTSPELGPKADWQSLLKNIDTVIHCAALIKHTHTDPNANLQTFRTVNTEGTIALARQASAAGVRRFIYISSIKVNGESTQPGKPFTFCDKPAPQDAYAISKSEAETALRALADTTQMELVVIRPPLVYGPQAKGNFAVLMKAIRHGIPIPLGGITENRRSLIAIDNLVDLITRCISHPRAANQTFLASDDEDTSTADLLKRLGTASGKPARLITISPRLLSCIATTLGKQALAQRLIGNLQVDIRHTRQSLDWTPPVNLDQGLRQAVANTKC